MKCQHCGNIINDEALFCKFCGKQQNQISGKQHDHSKYNYDNTTAPSERAIETEDSLDIKQVLRDNKLFYSNDERLIDTLGSGFISTLFVQNKFKKSVLFCSDKRVYQHGKIFEKNLQNNIIYYYGEKVVDLMNITGMSFLIDNPIHKFKYILPLFLLGILGFFLSEDIGYDESVYVRWLSFFFIILSFVLFVLYYAKKGKWLIIEYPSGIGGGMMMTNCNWYSKKSIKRFMKNISIQKEKLNSAKNGNQANNYRTTGN
ncbi:MAG: hypothetical protein K9I68_00215 [Bacteroidales bacterium]|nr:hypothetical protein [Bacteroidales bacterium]MCF8336402.1 hypothetical protein [Bacteroidales bacterium]